MDIKHPIPTWVLARLYDTEIPEDRKSLLRNLCQASFDTMNENESYSNSMNQLISEQLIEYQKISKSEFYDGFENYNYDYEGFYKGYSITEKGIIEFRRQIVSPLEKIKISNIDMTNKVSPDLLQLYNSFKSEKGETHRWVVHNAVQNAPNVLTLIKQLLANI